MYQKSRSKFGKLLLLLLIICCAIVLALGLSACSGDVKGISSAVVNDKGELVITYTDGTSDNLGVVVGDKGEQGEKGETGAQGPQGEQGEKGETGRGIKEVKFSEDGTKLIILYTDETKEEISLPSYGAECNHEHEEYLVFEEHTHEKEGTYLRVCVDADVRLSSVLSVTITAKSRLWSLPAPRKATPVKPAPFAGTPQKRRISRRLWDMTTAMSILWWRKTALYARTAACPSGFARAATKWR